MTHLSFIQIYYLMKQARPKIAKSVTSKSMNNKKSLLSQGNRAMPQLFFSFRFKLRRQHSRQV